MNPELRDRLDRVAARIRRARLWTGLAACWLAWLVPAAALVYASARFAETWSPPWWTAHALAGAGMATAAAWIAWVITSQRDPVATARRIEANHPALNAVLLAAVEPDRTGFLHAAVVRQALDHSRANDWTRLVGSGRLRALALAHVTTLGLFATAIGWLAMRPASQSAVAPSTEGLAVEPGDVSIERGAPLLVTARFAGSAPAEAELVIDGQGPTERRLTMIRALEDPVFAGRLESVEGDLAYRVAFRGRVSPTYHARVYEYPALLKADAKLEFPAYTAMPEKQVEDVRHVTAVEGTRITLSCRLNKDVVSARLVDQDGQEITLVKRAGEAVYEATTTLAEARKYRVRLVDSEGRNERNPAEISTHVLRNKPPTIKTAQPKGDVRVSPLEELGLVADFEDDFGLVKHGVAYAMAGDAPREIDLTAGPAATRKARDQYMIDFEALHALPDQLVSYFFWADDVGPDGKPRRTSGDMYFAEVRHFEEIFRQGEQPPGGSEQEQQQDQSPARQSDQLAELQKQVVNGVWKLIRRETSGTPTAMLAADARTLEESQRSAIAKATELGGKLTDKASKVNLERAMEFMKQAGSRLEEAARPDVAPLPRALSATQGAYQALLTLRAREFQIIRSSARRGQSSNGASGNPSNTRLEQLELSADENRFEQRSSARQAQSRQASEQSETRQQQSRLRELARRQNDLNERIKELRSALEAARTQAASDEAERRLKRLREQEQEILRDTDQLRERMEQDENRDRSATARSELEQSREHVRQASDALEQGQLARAATEGARAGEKLTELRDQMRKETSNQFSEQMTEIRRQARQLDQKQQKLAEQLEAWDAKPNRALRDADDRREARDGLTEQKKSLEQLLDRMRGTVGEAEESEPLLARSLFDTVREADQGKLADGLETSRQLVDLGVAGDAAKSTRQTGEGLTKLRERVERAADRILGDETATLRRAGDQLDDLAQQLNREIAQATGAPMEGDRAKTSTPPRPSANGRSGQPRAKEGDQTKEGEARTGDPRPEQPGQDSGGQADQPREGPRGQPGQANQDQSGRRGQPGQGEQGQGEQGQSGQGDPRQGQEGQGEQGQGRRSGGQGEPGNQPGDPNGQPGRPRIRGGGQGGGGQGGRNANGGLDRVLEGLNGGGPGGPGGPIAGGGFREWSDRMRDVEELLDDPELRNQAARVRDRARGEREEAKRHSKEPDWNKLKTLVAEPLNELRKRIADELRNRESPDSLAPVDRDPVPPQFAEGVRKYYERLGSGQ